MRKLFWLGLIASLGLTNTGWSQVPAAPAAPAPAAPANLWTFLCPTPDQKAAFKTCFCNSPLGQMINSGAAGPMSMMSGGLLPNCCQQNSLLNDLKKSADSPDGAAARVKKDEEECMARRAAVRYLGTVDCNYWPEAVDVLCVSLRKDRCECVRFEAALALQRGCCCNPKTMEALRISVSGSTEDGFPAEHSERVRAAAADALSHCVGVQEPQLIPELPTPQLEEKRKVSAPAPVDPAAYYKKINETPREELVAKARLALNRDAAPKVTVAAAVPAGVPQANERRNTSIAGIFSNAVNVPGAPAATPAPPMAAKAVPAPKAIPQTAAVQSAPIAAPVQAIPVSQTQPAPFGFTPPPPPPAPAARPEPRPTVFSILNNVINGRPNNPAPTGSPSVRSPAPAASVPSVPETAPAGFPIMVPDSTSGPGR